MPAPVELTADQTRFRALMKALKAEAGGQRYRAELRADIRAILAPGVEKVRQGVLNAPTSGLPHAGEPLRPAIAAGVKIGINSTGRLTGARVYASKKRMPRNFSNAPRDFNRDSWQHGTVVQVGAPGFFDDPLRADAGRYRAAIVATTERMAARVGHA